MSCRLRASVHLDVCVCVCVCRTNLGGFIQGFHNFFSIFSNSLQDGCSANSSIAGVPIIKMWVQLCQHQGSQRWFREQLEAHSCTTCGLSMLSLIHT